MGSRTRTEEVTMSIDEVRNQTGVKVTIAELIAGVALIITVFSALNGWIVLPEQVRALKEADALQHAKIAAIELSAQQKAEVLARIDERTVEIKKAIEAQAAKQK
jgi:hypothetical protein